LALLLGGLRSSAKLLSFGPSAGQTRLCALYQEVGLHFGHRRQHGQQELTGGTGQIRIPELMDNHVDALILQLSDGL
jgi:hypothetical protein